MISLKHNLHGQIVHVNSYLYFAHNWSQTKYTNWTIISNTSYVNIYKGRDLQKVFIGKFEIEDAKFFLKKDKYAYYEEIKQTEKLIETKKELEQTIHQESDFLELKDPLILKPRTKARMVFRINAIAKPIKYVLGLKSNDNIWISIFIGVSILVITGIVFLFLYKLTGIKLQSQIQK